MNVLERVWREEKAAMEVKRKYPNATFEEFLTYMKRRCKWLSGKGSEVDLEVFKEVYYK